MGSTRNEKKQGSVRGSGSTGRYFFRKKKNGSEKDRQNQFNVLNHDVVRGARHHSPTVVRSDPWWI